jgi:hypothetical protein
METRAMLALSEARYLERKSSCHLVAQPVGDGSISALLERKQRLP